MGWRMVLGWGLGRVEAPPPAPLLFRRTGDYHLPAAEVRGVPLSLSLPPTDSGIMP